MTPLFRIGTQLWFLGCILLGVGLLIRFVWGISAINHVSGWVLLTGFILLVIDGIYIWFRRLARKR